MATVGCAGTNVKVEQYFLTKDCPELMGAVSEVMSLFKAGLGNDKEAVIFLPKNGVLVKNMVYYDKGSIQVATKIHYYRQRAKENKTALKKDGSHFLKKESRIPVSAQDDSLLLAKRLTKLNVLSLMRKITGTNPTPWGILRGVRPGKIVRRLLDKGLKRPEIIKDITQYYGVEKKKAELLTDISIEQRALLRKMENRDCQKTVSIYIGVPYCPSKCLYCSFPSACLPKSQEELACFFKALKTDIGAACRLIAQNKLKVQAIYIGGGTPTSLSGQDFGQLLVLIKKELFGRETKEFTVEAGRPDSIDDEKVEYLRRSDVGRVSINPQTMQEKTLSLIGRKHTVQDIINAFSKIRQAKIPVVNMDVIAGLPGETEKDMADTMAQIEKLGPENITVHTLAIKQGSLLKTFLSQTQTEEKISLPNESTTRKMLQIADEYAFKMGMKPYYLYRQKYMTGNLENIGYAKPGTECFYNIQIIEERQTIIGIGPAAATKAVSTADWRLESCYNPKDVPTYIKNLPLYLQKRENLLARLYEV